MTPRWRAYQSDKAFTYGEVAGTETHEIITAAGGPKPWPELTETQRRVVAGRQRQNEEMRRQFSGYPTDPVGSI